MTKEDFETFATNLFTKQEELKSSIPAPILEPQPNPIAEAMKENTAALKALQSEISNLRASVATQENLKSVVKLLKAKPLLSSK